MSDAAKNGYYFEDLEIGMTASYARVVTSEDVVSFAEVSGDKNPVHLDEDYAANSVFKRTDRARHDDRELCFSRDRNGITRAWLYLYVPIIAVQAPGENR